MVTSHGSDTSHSRVIKPSSSGKNDDSSSLGSPLTSLDSEVQSEDGINDDSSDEGTHVKETTLRSSQSSMSNDSKSVSSAGLSGSMQTIGHTHSSLPGERNSSPDNGCIDLDHLMPPCGDVNELELSSPNSMDGNAINGEATS